MNRRLSLIGVVLAVVAWIATLTLPLYSTESSDGSSGTATLIEVNGWGAALMVRGAAHAPAWAARHPGVQALVAGADGARWCSPGMAAATSLLGSGGLVAQRWYQFGKGSGGGSTAAPNGDPIGALYELNDGWR